MPSLIYGLNFRMVEPPCKAFCKAWNKQDSQKYDTLITCDQQMLMVTFNVVCFVLICIKKEIIGNYQFSQDWNDFYLPCIQNQSILYQDHLEPILICYNCVLIFHEQYYLVPANIPNVLRIQFLIVEHVPWNTEPRPIL